MNTDNVFPFKFDYSSINSSIKANNTKLVLLDDNLLYFIFPGERKPNGALTRHKYTLHLLIIQIK